jgi:hypothetical protein
MIDNPEQVERLVSKLRESLPLWDDEVQLRSVLLDPLSRLRRSATNAAFDGKAACCRKHRQHVSAGDSALKSMMFLR